MLKNQPQFDGVSDTCILPIYEIWPKCIYVLDILVSQIAISQISADCQMKIRSENLGIILWRVPHTINIGPGGQGIRGGGFVTSDDTLQSGW